MAELLELDTERRSKLTQVEELRARRNQLSSDMKGQRPSDEQIAEGKQLKDEIAGQEIDLTAIEGKYTSLLMGIPNVTFDDVPVGGEADSVEIKVIGGQPGRAVVIT